MYTSLYAYPWSLAAEGPEHVLESIAERASCDGVCLAFQYHSGKFLLPHSPYPKVHFNEPAALYFRPDLARYANTAIQPSVSRLAESRDILGEAREISRRLDLEMTAWVVCLHNSVLGNKYPDATQHTVYGDPLTYSLCPSHPDVREYLKQLLVDIAVNYEPDVLDLESIEYLPFQHDHHHEMHGVNLDPYHEALIGLDFNPHTKRDLATRGVDVERVEAYVKSRLGRFFEDSREEASTGPDYFAHMFLDEPEMRKLIVARIAIITDLVSEVVLAVRSVSPARVNIMMSLWRPAHLAWLEGHDAKALAAQGDGLDASVYYSDEADIARELVHLRRDLGTLDGVTAIVSATAPLASSAADLRNMVKVTADYGVERLHFYNHGFMREENLDWIREATR